MSETPPTKPKRDPIGSILNALGIVALVMVAFWLLMIVVMAVGCYGFGSCP